MRSRTTGGLAAIAASFALLSSAAGAAEPALIREYVGQQAVPAALVNMDTIESSGGCQNFSGAIRVDGLQMSASGGTVDLFWFVDRNGARWTVPTHIGAAKFGSADHKDANNLIRVGGDYWVHIQACGTGAVATLISLYDMRMPFGAK